MVSNKLTHRRTSISNPKICKSPPTPPKAPTPPPPPWPPPYIRATLKCSGPTEEAERDLIIYPDYPHAPTYYSGYAAVGYAYASVQFQLGPATSIITPHLVSLHGQYTGWYAVNGDAYQIPNTAFAFFNTNWKYQTPTAAEIRLILAYP